MTAPPFNPYDLEDELQKGDQFTKDQAVALAKALVRVAYADIATKADVEDVKKELAAVKVDLEKEIASLGMKLTIRLGGITAGGVAFLALLIRFFGGTP